MHVGLFADGTASAGINLSYRAEKCKPHPAWEKKAK